MGSRGHREREKGDGSLECGPLRKSMQRNPAKCLGRIVMLMKSLVLVFVVISPLLGQPASTRDIAAASRKDIPVTAVGGVSWLEHLHRTFDQTSMGKTWLLGPPATMPGEHS